MPGAGWIMFVLWIAASNLVLGFALAVFMGHGPRRLPRLSLPAIKRFKIPAFKLQFPSWWKSKPQSPAAPPNEPETTSTETVPTASADAPVTTDDGLPLAEALAQFQTEIADVRSGFEDVRQRVQACTESPTPEAVEECVADLKDVSQRILDQRTDAMQTLQESSNGSAAQQQAIDDIQEASAQQATDIQEALDDIGQLELNPESLDDDCQRLQSHTDALVASCDSVSQTIDAAKSPASGETSAAPQLEHVEAAAALDDWWADDPEHERPLTMVMIDLDGVGALNTAIGETEVDALLTRVEEVVSAADIHGGRATQINPQRFLLLLPKVEMQKLTREVEQLRERIASLSVSSDQDNVPVTASCAIAFSRTGDSARALVARAEAALLEAKQFGGNRTFTNQGDFPTPVAATSLHEEAAMA